MTDTETQIEGRHLAALLHAAGQSVDGFSATPCSGGGNNRVFAVHSAGKRFIAKWYFTHPTDTRDRLRAEYAFLEYAHNLGLTCVPQPLASLPAERLALYEFIDGQKLQPDAISSRHVGEAASFFLALNNAQRQGLAGALPTASEACFSVADQIATIQRRVMRLSEIDPVTPDDATALSYAGLLQSALDTVCGRIARADGMDTAAILPEEDRCISPSDFGFHNALLRPSGDLCFLDFEYAGWDDPVKMACDFFCQPATPVNHAYFEGFMRQSLSYAANPEPLMARARIMLPLFQVKWLCIMLNEFLPDSARRRRFGNPDVDPGQRKRAQLAKVSRLYNSIFI